MYHYKKKTTKMSANKIIQIHKFATFLRKNVT